MGSCSSPEQTRQRLENISVSQLKKMNLYDARGNRLGDVEQVLQG
jgi:hypothetical protein